MTILNFGSINIDHIYKVPHLVRPGESLFCQSATRVLGGKGANQSIALASAGASVVHLGQISANDSWTIDLMHHAGVDTSLITQSNSASGKSIIQVDEEGRNTTLLIGGANQEFAEQSVYEAIDQLTTEDWLLVQNECNHLNEAVAYALKKGVKIAFNASPVTADRGSVPLPLDKAALLFISQAELAELSRQQDESAALSDLAQKYPETTIVAHLAEHSAVLARNSIRIEASAPPLNTVDLTASQDTFIGYFLAAHLSGHSEKFALTWACYAAAIASTKLGASSSIPLKKEVDALYIKLN